MAVAGQVEGVGQHGAGFFEVGLGGGELALDAPELGGDAVLLGLKELDRDGAGVVGVEQFLTLSGELDALLSELLALGFGGGVQCVELFEDEFLDGIAELLAERDGAVLVFDEFLDEIDGHGLALAVGGLAFASGAAEVGVGRAPAVLGVDQHQAGAAVAAEDAAT